MKLTTFEPKKYIYNIKKPGGGYLRTNNIILGKIIYEMKKGYSPLILVVGKQRTGKSFFAVWLSVQILKFFGDIKFNPMKHTFYDPIEAVKNLTTFKHEPLIIDEAGAYLNAKEWYSKINIAIEKIIISQAYLNSLFIFVSPFASDIAKGVRKQFHYVITMRRRGLAVIREIPKKYYDLSSSPPKPFFIEAIRLRINSINRDLWHEYEEYSFQKKEEIRKTTIHQEKFMKKDPFGRPIRDEYEITERFGSN